MPSDNLQQDRRRQQWTRSKQKKRAEEQELLLQKEQLQEQVAQLQFRKAQLGIKNALLNDLVEVRDLGILRQPRSQGTGSKSMCPICSMLSGNRTPLSMKSARKWFDLGYDQHSCSSDTSFPSSLVQTPWQSSKNSVVEPTVDITLDVIMHLIEHPVPISPIIKDGVVKDDDMDYSKGYERLLAIVAGQVARVESADHGSLENEQRQLKKILLQFFHMFMFHSQWESNFKWYQNAMAQYDAQKGTALIQDLRRVLAGANLTDQQVQAVWLARSNTMQRLQLVYQEREQIRDGIQCPALQDLPTSSVEVDLENRVSCIESLQRTSGLEILLILELEWILYLQILEPLLVAKLMIHSFPTFPDTFIVANLITQEAATRGFFAVDEVDAQQKQWAALFPSERRTLPYMYIHL